MLRLAFLLPLLALAACGGSNSVRHGGASSTTAHTAAPTATPVPPPATAGLYFRTEDQTLIALNPHDGSQRWSVAMPHRSAQDVVATDRVVYTYDDKGVVALRASDGSRLWSYPTSGAFTFANGVIYVHMLVNNTNGAVPLTPIVALDGLTGAPRWTSQPVRWGTITIAGSLVVVSYQFLTSTGAPAASSLSVLAADTGQVLWRLQNDSVGFIGPVTQGNTLYLGMKTVSDAGATVQTHVNAYRLTDGALLWQSDNIQYFNHMELADDNAVYVVTGASLVALRASDGHFAWTDQIESLGMPLLANGVIYAPHLFGATSLPGLTAINAASGAQLWNQSFQSNPLIVPPVAVGGAVYLPTRNYPGSSTDVSRLYAFDATSGQQQWALPGGMGYPATSNGTLYTYGGAGASVYALNASTGSVMWKYNVGRHLESDLVLAE